MCDAFKWSVAPWFIIRREHREVESVKEFVVFDIENAVVTVEICRDEHHLHSVAFIVLQAIFAQSVEHHIPLIIMDIVSTRKLSVTVYLDFFLQTICQILRWACDIAWHRNHRHDVTFQVLVVVQLRQHLDIQVNTFIMELIATAVYQQQRITRDLFSTKGVDDFKNLFSAVISSGFERSLEI